MIHIDQDYIRVIDSVIPPQHCEDMIRGFDACRPWQTRQDRYQRLCSLDLMGCGPDSGYDWHDHIEFLADTVRSQALLYQEHWDRFGSFPQEYAMEGFRIKSYTAGTGDGFPIHCDANCAQASTRFLACLFYLNDSDAGTEFPQQKITIAARQGRLLIFPPGLQWPHIGHEPLTGCKYIISTYLLFA